MSVQELRNNIINSNVEYYNNLFSNAPDSEIIHLYSLYFYVREQMIAADYYDDDDELRAHLLYNVRNMCSLYYDRMQYMEPEKQQIPRSEDPEYKAANGDFDAIYALEEEEEGHQFIIEDYNEYLEDEGTPGTYNYFVKNQTAARAEYCEQWINRDQ